MEIEVRAIRNGDRKKPFYSTLAERIVPILEETGGAVVLVPADKVPMHFHIQVRAALKNMGVNTRVKTEHNEESDGFYLVITKR